MDENILKSGGFIKLRQPDRWAVRVKVLLGEVSADQLSAVADIAREFGDGELHLTVRQGIEIRGVKINDFDPIRKALDDTGLGTGSCGARVRVPVACPGSLVCKRGVSDTRELAMEIDRRLYGRDDTPHKIKVAVSGCSASCAKPQGNDIGFGGVLQPIFDEKRGKCIACGLCATACLTGAISLDDDGRPVIDHAHCDLDGACVRVCPTESIRAKTTGWRVYLGGKYGAKPAHAYQIAAIVETDEAVVLAERAIDAYVRLGEPRERLRDTIDRVGLSDFTREVVADV